MKGEYFANAAFPGHPILIRTDPQIQFDWNAASPAPGIPMKEFSVRWSGTVAPPRPGDYTFSIRIFHCYRREVREGVKVFLNGKRVIDSSQSNPIPQGTAVTNRSGYTSRPQEPSFNVHFADTQAPCGLHAQLGIVRHRPHTRVAAAG